MNIASYLDSPSIKSNRSTPTSTDQNRRIPQLKSPEQEKNRYTGHEMPKLMTRSPSKIQRTPSPKRPILRDSQNTPEPILKMKTSRNSQFDQPVSTENYNTAHFSTPQKEEKSQFSMENTEKADLNYYLSQLMVPRIMKISINNTPFQKALFILSLKYWEKYPTLENFVFEWLDVNTLQMVGYVRCEFIRHIHKQPKNRFCVVCCAPKKQPTDADVLHYIYIECKSSKKCEIYVRGLQLVCAKYQEDLKALRD